MITKATGYEFTNFPITATGLPFDSFANPALEQYLALNEAVRYLEIACSFVPGNRSATYTIGKGLKDNAAAMFPARAKFENLKARANAAKAVQYWSDSRAWNEPAFPDVVKTVDGFWINSTASSFPGLSVSEAENALASYRKTNGSVSTEIGMSVKRENMTDLWSAYSRPTIGSLRAASSFGDMLSCSQSWMRNGSSNGGPDTDASILTPWAKSSRWATQKHAASFYYRVNYSSETSYPDADYTYSLEPSNISYSFPRKLYSYTESDVYDYAQVEAYMFFGAWKASIWECSHEGSSSKFLEYGDKGLFKAFLARSSSYNLDCIFQARSTGFKELYYSAKALGDRFSGMMENKSWKPDAIVPKYDKVKLVGWATYVEPLVVIWKANPHWRTLGT